jgi:hypothetical protein
MKRIPARQRSDSLRYYYRRRRKFAPGNPEFTTLGTPRKKVWKWSPREKRERVKKWWRDSNRRTRERQLARGLTTRGTPRVNRQFPELRGLKRPEYDRVKYHLLRQRANRSGLATLLQGRSSLAARLKGRR